MTNILSIFLACLAEVESGGNDHAVGSAGERLRYQIKPIVWRAHAPGVPMTPALSHQVVASILHERASVFEAKTRRRPTASEVYALWNAPGLFAKRGYQVARLPKVVRDRCVRYENLVARRLSEEQQVNGVRLAATQQVGTAPRGT
jgi:hypothetical protein